MDNRFTPFFTVAGGENPRHGRLLLLTFNFPPGGSAGALRWQRLADHLAADGWGLDVLTVDPSSLKSADLSRLQELPPGTRVFGAPTGKLLIDRVEQTIWNAFRALRGLRKKRVAPAVPAAGPTVSPEPAKDRPHSLGRLETLNLRWTPRVFVRTYYWYLYSTRNKLWSDRAAKIGRRIANARVHRAVISSGPPHESHFSAWALARRLGLPHVVDMRDPWSLGERLPEVIATPIAYRAAARKERRVVRDAALIVCNTVPAQRALQGLYPAAAARCVAVMNGFDDEVLPPPQATRRFVIAYAGSIYLDRTPRELFRAAARVVRTRGLTPDDFAIEFMGSEEQTAGKSIVEQADEEGLSGFVRSYPSRPRREALEFLAGAAMLVSLPQDSRMAIPSKVFEYMPYDAWLLALADEGSATQQVLAGSGADVVDPNDVERIEQIIGGRYDLFRSSGRPRRPALVPACSRAAQAQIFLHSLHGVVANHSPVQAPDRSSTTVAVD